MDKYIGKKLDGRYELQRVIGVGGMAVVYKAVDVLTNMTVAVKILKDEYFNNEEFCQRFRNEARAMAMLKHKNIIKVFDVSNNSSLQYIVMELVDGITLKEYIEQQGALDWRETVHFTAQILRALQQAHDKGVVHRDIKPQNIMLMENGDIKVSDFGIARIAGHDNAVAAGNQAIGSAHYISPEQARGAQTDARTDLYSVGVMMYEMLTGRLPFDGKDPVSVAVMHLQADPRMPRELDPSIPEGLEEIILQAMQKNPDNRYQTAAEMLMDIEDFKHDPDIRFEYRYMVDDSPSRYINAINTSRRMQEEQYERVKSPVIPVLSGIAAAFIIVTLVMVWLVFDESGIFEGNSTASTKMPNFVGSNYTEVTSDPRYSFAFIVQYEFSNEYPQDTVISQVPAPGKDAYVNTRVTLTVSNGVERLIVPEYGNMTYDEYSDQCMNLGLRPSKIEVYDDTVAEGYVIITKPLPRSDINEGDTVEIYVSQGKKPETLIMPNFVNMSYTDAKAKLSAMGIESTSTEEADSEKPQGTVISQTPAAGSEIKEGDSVHFTISNGKTPSGTVTLQITLPEGLHSQSLRVEVLIDSVSVFQKNVNTDDEPIVAASINGAGSNKKAMVYLNGSLYETYTVDFTQGIATESVRNPDFSVGTTAPDADTTQPQDDTQEPSGGSAE